MKPFLLLLTYDGEKTNHKHGLALATIFRTLPWICKVMIITTVTEKELLKEVKK